MSIPLRQNLRMAAYLMRRRLAKTEKYPLIVELEPEHPVGGAGLLSVERQSLSRGLSGLLGGFPSRLVSTTTAKEFS